jgi:CheY-like chemotaxis protein
MAGRKILVADDSLTIQKVIRLALSNEGYEIQAVSDGNQASQQIVLFRPDVVLIDVSLPGKTAFEVKREISSQDLPNTRFILMSSAFEKFDESKARALAFHGRLTKPFDPADLRKALTQVMTGMPAATPSPANSASTPPPAPSASDSIDSLSGLHVRPDEELELQTHPHMTQAPEDFFQPPKAGMPPAPPSTKMSAQSSSQTDDELWGQPENAPPVPSSDEDIQRLTESTLKIAGLDSLEWSVNETGKKGKNPPPPSHAPTPPPSKPANRATADFFQEPTIAPPSIFFEDSKDPNFPPINENLGSGFGGTGEESGGSAYHNAPDTELNFPELSSDLLSRVSVGKPGATEAPPIPPGVADLPPASAAYPQQVIQLNTPQIEELIRKQIEAALTQMAQKMIPDMAEKVIKQEINRLLNETL